MPNRLIHLVIASCVLLLASACAPQGDSADPDDGFIREIIHITGDLYEARDPIHNTVFLVTPEGIILGDPIGAAFAHWLKPELAERFGTTVEYVIYSHHHPEHATGGNVFADTATFVAHENVVTALDAPFPSNAGQMDRDGNGRIERSEATDPGYPGNFDIYDRDGDDSITGVEINADTPRPDIVYSNRMSITLGGSTVELIHPGPAHSDDMTVLFFPEQRALFGVDLLHVRRFPVSLNGYPVDRYVNATAKLQDLDFDTVVAGHGNIVGDKADLVLYLDFLRALEAAVAGGIAEGKSLDELLETLSFPEYEDWLRYEDRRVTLIADSYDLLIGQEFMSKGKSRMFPFNARLNKTMACSLFGFLAAGSATITSGHHAAQVTYHTDQLIEVEGEITRLLWRNPHLRFTIDATDAQGGAGRWAVESIPVTRLTRVGISADTVGVGQTVRVAGFPSRRSANEVYAINMLLPDGREVLLDTPVARWTNNTIGTGRDESPGTASADPSLGIFRVWSTDGVPLGITNNQSFQLTAQARAAEAAWDPLSPSNPFRGCTPKGMPSIMEQPNPMEFVDRGDQILLRLEEYDTVRTISMRGGPSDESIQATPLGHSVGRWDGRTFVVETGRISWRNFSQSGLIQSEAIEVIERFTPSEDGARLDYELRITDPALFTEPAVLTKSWVWVPGDRVLPFDCTDD